MNISIFLRQTNLFKYGLTIGKKHLSDMFSRPQMYLYVVALDYYNHCR